MFRGRFQGVLEDLKEGATKNQGPGLRLLVRPHVIANFELPKSPRRLPRRPPRRPQDLSSPEAREPSPVAFGTKGLCPWVLGPRREGPRASGEGPGVVSEVVSGVVSGTSEVRNSLLRRAGGGAHPFSGV